MKLRRAEIVFIVLLLIPGMRGSCQSHRDWRLWPFSRNSPWNEPIGSNARYQAVPELSSLPAGIAHRRWTSDVVIARKTDPVVQLLFNPATGPSSNWVFLSRGGKTCGNNPSIEKRLQATASARLPFSGNYYSTISAPNTGLWKLPELYQRAGEHYSSTAHLPLGACPSPDSDALMAVFQPDGRVLDAINTIVMSDGTILASMASYVDARGDGTGFSNGRRASMLPSFAGLIRKGEIESGRIPHAIAALAPQTLLKPVAVWPAAAFDRSSHYTGTLPMGSLLAIPPSVDIAKLGLSQRGQVIARAAQDYGVYIVDSGGSGITLLAELGDSEAHWADLPGRSPEWRDIQVIVHHLQRVVNNTEQNPGGGGIPRAPLAPKF